MAKPVLEDSTDCGYQRRAAGEKDAVDCAVAQPRASHYFLNGVFNRCEIRRDPEFKLITRDGSLQVESVILEAELSLVPLRERDLGALDRLMQLIAKVGLDQLRQGRDFFWLEGSSAGCAKHFADCAGA